MGPLVFLQLPFLLGLVAVALPPIIHLIHRQKRRRVPFSTIRFLLQTDRRSARKYRLVDFLVLALRMAVLLLLVLALAQPVLRPRAAGDVAFGKLSLAIVIDDSMSMQRASNGVRLFDRALEEAKTVLRETPQDGEALIVLSSGRTPAALSVPASPPSSLADLIGDLKASYGGRPLATAVGEALDALKASKNRHRALGVIGDLQTRSLEGGADLDREEIEREVRSVQWIDVGGEEANVGVQEATVWPEAAFPGTPVRVRTRVYNSGEEPADAELSLWVDDQKVDGQTLSLQPQSAGEATFDRVVNQSGWTELSIRVEPDGLAGDNSRYVALRVLEPVEAFLVTPKSGAATREAVFLETALAPLVIPNYSGESPVRVTRSEYLTAGAGDWSGYDFVFCLESPDMPERVERNLLTYVKDGGRAMIFPSVEFGSLSDGGEGRTYAGLTSKGTWVQGPDEGPVGFGEYDRKHPVFELLAQSAPDLFSTVAVKACLLVDESKLGPYDRVLARFTSGAPALIETQSDRGTLLIWTTGPHTWWNDLPLRPLFLPILFESLKYAETSGNLTARGGSVEEGFRIRLNPAEGERILRVGLPGGQTQRVVVAAGREEADFYEADTPGLYRIEMTGERAVMTAVNAEPAESDLRRSPEEAVKGFLPESILAGIERDGKSVALRLSHATKGFPLAGWLMGLALVALLLEMYLSNALLRRSRDLPAGE